MAPSASAPETVAAGDPGRTADTLATELGRRAASGPVTVASAPGRVNVIGEHLDYNAGRCLPLALPHAAYAAVAPRGDRVLTMRSLQQPDAHEIGLDHLAPGSVQGWAAYVAGVVWALEQAGWTLPGLDVLVDSTVPLGSGLSSSAALECSVAVALLAVAEVPDSAEARRTLVGACVRAETEMVGAPTGGMDQTVSLLGAEHHALLIDFADGTATQVPWAPETEGLSLLVTDTRVSHRLADGGYASRRADCEEAARELDVSSLRDVKGDLERLGHIADPRVRRRARHVLTEMDRVDAAVDVLTAGDHAALGPLLDGSHDSLREDFEVSCEELDTVVDTCRRHGALGARLTGGGFGGSAIALLPQRELEGTRQAVVDAFARRAWRPPRFLEAPASPGARRLR